MRTGAKTVAVAGTATDAGSGVASTAFTFSPASVDTRSGAKQSKVTAEATDSQSGVLSIGVTWMGIATWQAPVTVRREERPLPGNDGFLPSKHAFAFRNSWPSQPARTLKTPFGRVPIGNARDGLCGGMVLAALDHWNAGTPPSAARPSPGTPPYDFIVRRLVDSWHIPAGVVQYYQWMTLPDGDSGFEVLGRHVVTERGLSWRTKRMQWPQIRTDLDAGVPVPLGVVTVASVKPQDLALNHQILAYAYEADTAGVTLRTYDPNKGPRDDIAVRFTTSSPTRPTTIEHNLGVARPVRGFFRVAYSPATPPVS